MNFKRYGNFAWPMAALAMLAGTALAGPAPSHPASSVEESHDAAGLLRDIRMDARQVRAHAWRWAMLTKSQSSTWYDFDKQWNEIKPPVEDINMKLVRLVNMKSSLPLWEQRAINRSQPLVTGITAETHDLKKELDRYYSALSNPLRPASESDSKVLARDAGRLVRTVQRPEAESDRSATPGSMTKS